MTTQSAKSGRPTAFDRQAAVAAAMDVFWKKGFLSVSAKDLAEAMSIQRSSFYNSFGSREALYQEVLQAYRAQSPDRVLDAIVPGDAVIPVLASFLRALCRIRAADDEGRGCLISNGIAELVGVDETMSTFFENAVQRRTQFIADLIKQAADQGEIPLHGTPQAMAHGFMAFLMGLNVLAKVVRDEAQLWAACRQFLSGWGVEAALLVENEL